MVVLTCLSDLSDVTTYDEYIILALCEEGPLSRSMNKVFISVVLRSGLNDRTSMFSDRSCSSL